MIHTLPINKLKTNIFVSQGDWSTRGGCQTGEGGWFLGLRRESESLDLSKTSWLPGESLDLSKTSWLPGDILDFWDQEQNLPFLRLKNAFCQKDLKKETSLKLPLSTFPIISRRYFGFQGPVMPVMPAVSLIWSLQENFTMVDLWLCSKIPTTTLKYCQYLIWGFIWSAMIFCGPFYDEAQKPLKNLWALVVLNYPDNWQFLKKMKKITTWIETDKKCRFWVVVLGPKV